MIKIGMIEQDPVVRHGFKVLLNQHSDFETTLTTDTIDELYKSLSWRQKLDVLLLDVNLADNNLVEELKSKMPKTEIIVLTPFKNDTRLNDLYSAGISNSVAKRTTIPELQEAIFSASENHMMSMAS